MIASHHAGKLDRQWLTSSDARVLPGGVPTAGLLSDFDKGPVRNPLPPADERAQARGGDLIIHPPGCCGGDGSPHTLHCDRCGLSVVGQFGR